MGRSENSVLSPALIVIAAIVVVLVAGFVLCETPAGAKDTASDVSGEDGLTEATFYVA
jgi:hypothetical protein